MYNFGHTRMLKHTNGIDNFGQNHDAVEQCPQGDAVAVAMPQGYEHEWAHNRKHLPQSAAPAAAHWYK